MIEIAPVAALLGACIALTLAAGPAMQYAYDAALALHEPARYLDEVLSPP